MVELTLKDMGTYNVDGNQGNASTEETAFGTDGTKGAALNIHAKSINVVMSNFLNREPTPQVKDDNNSTKRFEISEVDKNGIDYPMWVIKGSFNTKIESHMKEFGRLMHMCKTKGYKQLGFTFSGSRWVSGASALDDQADLINYSHYGEREYDSETTKTVDRINVRIHKFEPSQEIRDGTEITYTLDLIETDPWK